MGRRADRHGGRDDGRRLEGAYEKLRQHTLDQADVRNDPELRSGMGEMPEAKRRRLIEHRRDCFRCRSAKTSLSLYNAERRLPLTVPGWYFGGARFFPEARGWPELEQYNLFIVKPDDTITPLVDSGPPRSPLNEAAELIAGNGAAS